MSTEKPLGRNPIDRADTTVALDVEKAFAGSPTKLSPRKQRMVIAWVREGTYTAAAEASGYNANTCRRYLTEDEAVQDAVTDLIEQASEVTGITLERVLQEMARIAFADVGDILDVIRLAQEDGDVALAKLADMPRSSTAAIQTVKYTTRSTRLPGDSDAELETATLEIKMYDKQTALTNIGRIMALFTDKLAVEDNTEFGKRLQLARAKLEAEPGDDGET